ncbi:MAG: hypothetical protein J2P26_10550, partial [Nocardiopsaceae bacterium]|nr:hypothetical protein [Nocardiopsaceae bacterium]
MAANIALILASQGQRVLVVDHDLASPSLHRYLSAFLPAARTGPWSDTPVRLEGDFGHPHGTIDFLGPATDSPAPAPGSPSPAPASPGTCAVGRPDLVTMDYDVVLIDTPAGVGAAPIAEELADIVVLGFTLSQQHRNRAVQLAREIENGARGNAIRILPVPMRVDQAAGQATAQRRIAAHRQFAWLVEDLTDAERQRYWADVEIPYEPDYADEEGLPFLDQPSVHRERLVGAHLKLARRLLPGMPEMALPPAPDPALRRYREAREDAARRNNTVTILHAAADRYWAEWIAAALRSMEFTAARRWIDRVRAEDLPPGPTLIVVSARLLGLPGLEDRLRRVIARAQADSQVPGAVTIDGTWLPDELFPRLGKVSLLGKNAKEAHEELASYYQVPGSIAPSANQLYFPGRRESFGVNLPAFISSPAGRDDIIDRIRDHFTARETPPPLTLTGPAGMGKTQIALEYAARFRSYYDTIALIRADSAEAVQTGLGKLAAQKPPKHPAGDPRAAVLEELRSGPAERWLLIYSGADQPAVLDGLIPEASEGHVLVTAREAVRDGSVPLAVPRLAPADATAVVSGLVEGILPEDADWVAEAMRGIPLALRLACAWLRVTAGELARDALPATITRDAVLELKSRYSSEPGQADPVGFTARLHLGDLPRGHLGRAATLLLQTCAFLGSSGLPWRILRSPEMRERLARENPEMSDPIMLSSALHELAKRGLLLLDDADLLPGDITRAPLRIHPRVLDVVRDGLTAEQRSQRRARTATLLATSVTPGIIDDVVEGEEVYAELLEHVGPSGAAAQTDD